MGGRFGFILATLIAFHTAAKPLTTLGNLGDQILVEKYLRYRNQPSLCGVPQTNLPRAIVTGFGPFAGGIENFSGMLVDYMGGLPRPPHDTDAYGGPMISDFFGTKVEVCYLVFDVLWDISSAVLVNEISSFQPSFVLLTGIGSNYAGLETGALNHASMIEGYDITGRVLPESTPVDTYVLPPKDSGVQPQISFTWKHQKIFAALEPIVTSLGFLIKVEPPARPANSYLCNNISFVTAHAAQGVQIRLAGERIVLQPQLTQRPSVGFFHLPRTILRSRSTLEGWANVLRLAIKTELEN